MFFTSRSGSLYPVSRIEKVRFWRNERDESIYAVELKGDGSTIEVDREEFDRLKQMPVSYVPALPGTQLIDGTDSDDLIKEDVVVWSIDATGYPTPLTVEGPYAGTSNRWVILLPSGMVTRPEERSWETLGEYLAECRKGREGTK